MVDKADITLPNYKRPKLILMPSFKAEPVAPVFLALYDPAKSTKKNFALIEPYYASLPFISLFEYSEYTICLMKMVKMA